MPILLVKDGLLKKRINFKIERTITFPVATARVFESRKTDELILLNINRDIDYQLIKEISEELYIPFAYGGGIISVEQMTEIIKNGAEKVVINTSAVENPKLITEGAKKFGNQCIIVSIDAKKKEDGSYEVYTHSGTKATGLNPLDWAKKAEELGAGEILINSIDHEGVMKGYNIELIKMISDSVKIPVIAAGGAGKEEDFVEVVIKGHASAVAAGSIYHYTSIIPNMVKAKLRKAGIPVRITDKIF